MESKNIADEFDFVEDEDEVIRKSKIFGAHTTASVRINTKTGKIDGWESLFELLEMDKEYLCVDLDDADMQANNLMTRIRPGDYHLTQINAEKFMLEHRNGAKFPIFVEDMDGVMSIEGLPDELELPVSNFSYAEKKNNLMLVLQSAIKQREGANIQLKKYEENLTVMPNEFEAKTKLKFDIRTEDPSKYYDILGRIGEGASSRVFKVNRKADEVICALKFVEPKTLEERMVIHNEVGLMLLCKENDGIIQCHECFDFRDRLWIFLEMMDCSLTPLLEDMSGQISEEFCKFVCLRTLCGIKFLHDRHILHRDIKSDNVLISSTGGVKLADFGYAT